MAVFFIMAGIRILESVIQAATDISVASSDKIHNIESLKRCKLVVAYSITYACCGIIFAPLYLLLGCPAGAAAIVLSDFLILGAIPLLAKTGSHESSGNWVLLNVYLLLAFLGGINGGLTGPSLPWLISLPVAAVLLNGRRSGIVWTYLCAALPIGFYLLQLAGVSFPQQLSSEAGLLTLCLSLVILSMLALQFALIYENYTEEALRTLKSLAVIDEETEMLNTRGFHPLAGQQLRLASRDPNGLTLLYFFLPLFPEAPNTTASDEMHRAAIHAAQILKGTFRSSDLVARLTADRFVVSCVGVDPENTDILLARLILNLGRFNQRARKDNPLQMLISTLHSQPRKNVSVEELIEEAEAKLQKKMD